jgi:hypothetical protein
VSAFFSFLPLVLLVLIEAGFVKVAPLMLRWQVNWAAALMFSALVVAVQTAGAVFLRVFDLYLPLVLGILFSLAVQIACGGWLLGTRAAIATAEPLGFRRGALLSLIAYGLVLVLGIVLWVLLAAVLPMRA